MDVELDISDKFSVAIDFTGVSDLHTYIDIGLTNQLDEVVSFSLLNFSFNLDSELVERVICNNSSLSYINSEGLFFIKKARFTFHKVKGGDAVFYNSRKHPDQKEYYTTWDYINKIVDGDRVYEVGGMLDLFPELKIHLYIVSNGCVSMSFDLDDFIYFDPRKINYINIAKEMNIEKENLIKNRKSGRLFNSEFRNKYLIENLESDEVIIKMSQ